MIEDELYIIQDTYTTSDTLWLMAVGRAFHTWQVYFVLQRATIGQLCLNQDEPIAAHREFWRCLVAPR